MDILAQLPDTNAGRHTKWLWSRMLAFAGGGPALDGEEFADHFAPSVFEQVSVEQLVAHFAQLAPTMPLVSWLVEEASSDRRYSALLGLSNLWLRYACVAQENDPHLLVEAAYAEAVAPDSYSDRRVQLGGRDVQIRDFGGTGPLMLLWHGAGCDLTHWETLVPHLCGFHVVGQDLPGHGRSPVKGFTTENALADADAVVAELAEGPPIVVGHSLGGYLGLRYAATRRCSGWIGLDGPFGIVYPWEPDDAGLPEAVLQIGREIRAIDVVGDFAAMNCHAMLVLCSIAARPVEECLVTARGALAEHIARCCSNVRIEWVPTGHDMILFHQPQETARRIRDFLLSYGVQWNVEDDAANGNQPIRSETNRTSPAARPRR
jgi:hypothetical protein